MEAITLLYHDVVTGEDYDSSGFPGIAASTYKLSRSAFIRHLDAIREALAQPLTTVGDSIGGNSRPVMVAFDDGGAGACEHIGPLLEERGWRGHFFITTDWIGKPGFLDRNQIRALREQGHVIGSHSCSHPDRMTVLPAAEIRREWTESVSTLSEIVGEPVTSGSVPSGYYSRAVGAAAAEAGIRALFYSEPITSVREVGGCKLYGRYSIRRFTPAHTAASIAAGASIPRFQQYAYWEIKKIGKRLGGETSLIFRRLALAKLHANALGE